MRNAIRCVYPNIDLNTCWFHFCQAAKRKAIQMQSFANAANSTKKRNPLINKLLALSLLPPDDIAEILSIINTYNHAATSVDILTHSYN